MAKGSATLAKASTGQKAFVLVLLAVLIGLGYWMLIYRPMSEEIDSSNAMSVTLAREERTWIERRRTYQADVDELNQRRARARQQSKILPVAADMDAFLDNLNSIAELSGLRIHSATPEREQPAEGFYARLPLRLELQGRYFQLAKFLFNIGRVERIINMENIEIGQPHLVDNDVVLTAKVLATSFRALSEAEMDATGEEAVEGTERRPGG